MLPDILKKNLKIVFVGINPGKRSDKLQHYYAGRSNQFWQLLYDSKLTPSKLSPYDDLNLLGFEIGLTDVIRQATRNSGEARKLLNRGDIDELNKRIRNYTPQVVCFNGKEAYGFFIGRKVEKLGLQSEKMRGAKVFVVPSSSGTNTWFTRKGKLQYYKELKKVSEEM